MKSSTSIIYCDSIYSYLLFLCQSWSPDDYRNVRFLDNPKQVNSRWSIDLIKAVPPVVVEGRTAVCEGGPSEALGHPKIYINLDQPGNHSCSYCGIRFVKKETAH
ncbi:hypothetical protein HAZT_HAZT004915 [Hyalella azteca]|uniref:Zinc finger CHCC-type domain-containing protein n=1 Tax=Hyalella azteca TaxID=294128 RepID=A0A6A0GW48_HYAAZ|nr:hypothetical protein HAZT_HAZT004915 [Hyalella azteca]